MILFDIGANRGDATSAGMKKGFTKIVAVEAAPRVFYELVTNFIYAPQVVPLRFAVSDTDNETIEFYECVEDGLSTTNKNWLTDPSMPYNGKSYRTVKANTITIDTLCSLYGEPDLIKIDVEGAEWSVFKGMTKHHGKLAFEWTDVTIPEHVKQLEYLASLGYTKVGPQYIVHHLDEPSEWYSLDGFDFPKWVRETSDQWTKRDWKKAGLRPTADVGMLWVS